ncbi:MAG TPA: hypothetical protein VM008_15190 [Phycisphaerae bacterium]|nr:hypothetical protein [Phycisphaerae bacterium]
MNRMDLRHFLLLCVTLCAAASLALLSGCKGNTSAAAMVEKTVSPPPHVQAYETRADPRYADPLTNPVWTAAHWLPLVSPIGTDRTTDAASGAFLFDANTLYVAIISHKPESAVAQDLVSVFLDSSRLCNGSEIIHVAVNSAGRASCTWIRDAEPPSRPRDDGTPDAFHPLSKIPVESMVPDLFTHIGAGTQHGRPVWTAVIAIPVRKLPLPLQAAPVAGTEWKVNLLRTTVATAPSSNLEPLQSNLSPVFVGQQAVAPYRMATLELVNTQVSVAQ